MKEFHESALPTASMDPKTFADSVGAKLVMPSKRLLDKSRDCTDYFNTNVAGTFEQERRLQSGKPLIRQVIRRAK